MCNPGNSTSCAGSWWVLALLHQHAGKGRKATHGTLSLKNELDSATRLGEPWEGAARSLSGNSNFECMVMKIWDRMHGVCCEKENEMLKKKRLKPADVR